MLETSRPTKKEDKLSAYKASIINKCFHKFISNKKRQEELAQYLVGNLKLLESPEEFHRIVESEDKEKFRKLFQEVPFKELYSISQIEGINIKDEEASIIQTVQPKIFYRVEFDENMILEIVPLRDDEIWDQSKGGLNKSKPFIVNNSGNDPQLSILVQLYYQLDVGDNVRKALTGEVKILEKRLREVDDQTERRQYLVTINEKNRKENMELIKAHNSCDGSELREFTTPYSKRQTRAIYAPLVLGEDDSPLPKHEIEENLSRAVSLNPSFGSFSANCQVNALIKLMREAGVPEETVKSGIESMHRFDAPNMVKIQVSDEQYPANQSVVFQASNDQLAIGYGAKLPEEYRRQNISRSGKTTIISTPVPDEVWNPAKRVTDSLSGEKREPFQEERKREDAVTQGMKKVKTLEEIRSLGYHPNSMVQKLSQGIIKEKAKNTLKDRTKLVLKDEGLDEFRYSDNNRHSRPHVVGIPTPGNKVEGRDPNLLYKMMSDTLKNIHIKDVSRGIAKSIIGEATRRVMERREESIKTNDGRT